MQLPGCSTVRSSLYVFLLQIKHVAGPIRSGYCSWGWYRYLYKPSSGSMLSFGYFSNLPSLKMSSFIASFGFIQSIDDFFMLILLTKIFRFLTQIVDTFVGTWSYFANYLLKASKKAAWVCVYFVVFLWISKFCFSRSLVTSFLYSENTFGFLNTPLFLHITSNTNASLLAILVSRAPDTLNLDVVSTPVNLYPYVFSSQTLS